jgi:hypothetical protein
MVAQAFVHENGGFPVIRVKVWAAFYVVVRMDSATRFIVDLFGDPVIVQKFGKILILGFNINS